MPYVKVGTIRGRHPDMPCDEYLIDNADACYDAPQYMFQRVYNAALKLPFDPHRYEGVELFYTGYTVATIAAVFALESRGIPVTLMVYRPHKDAYTRVTTKMRTRGVLA